VRRRNEANLRLVATFLSEMGRRGADRTRASGIADWPTANPFELFFMDVQMPAWMGALPTSCALREGTGADCDPDLSSALTAHALADMDDGR